jgi:hypothetical protein
MVADLIADTFVQANVFFESFSGAWQRAAAPGPSHSPEHLRKTLRQNERGVGRRRTGAE